MKLFNRTYRVNVAGAELEGLRIAFSVKKTLRAEPNTCTLQVWNLNDATRELLSQPKQVQVLIEAGYNKQHSAIFQGYLRGATSQIQGPDITTLLSSGDGDRAFQSARLSVPFGPKTSNDIVLLELARSLGVQPGNVQIYADRIRGRSSFPVATNISGSAADALSALCDSSGLEWSIQDGALQILELNKPTEVLAYVLKSESGLIGSPSISYDSKTKKQTVRAETLMLPGLKPGSRVVFDSRFVKGAYRIEEIEYDGDTFGDNWGQRLACSLV